MTERLVLAVERVNTPAGPLLLTHNDELVCNVEFADQPARRERELARYFPDARVLQAGSRSGFAQALARYVDGDIQAIDAIPTARIGTLFQLRAWDELRRIPAGTTRRYAEHATTLGNPNAARAVGHANGANPFAVIIPCHRLVASNGSLVRYAGGLDRKRWLLEHEARHSASASCGVQTELSLP